ncbi:MAG: PmoA family protein [Planctomycetaceae bacterium]|nr:PmoA family protein [Planctomycetaceae bacterium]
MTTHQGRLLFVAVLLCVSVPATTLMAQSPLDSGGQDSKPLFVLAGDSTVTDKAGWGAGFAELLNEGARCINMARGGRSSRSYRTEGWWKKCLDLKPDYLLIQFGHNDQPGKGPERESKPETEFRDHLRQYVDEARTAGIQPVLLTSLTRRKWDGQKIVPSLEEYAQATLIVAGEKQIPVIDLHTSSIRQCELLGPTAFRAFEPMTEDGADHTHLNLDGSRAVAPLVVTELLKKVPSLEACFDAEKLAASAVPQPYEGNISNGSLSLEETADTITIRNRDRVVLVYNKVSPPVPEGINPVYHRSGFLHPVMSPDGGIVTAAFPFDHAHQHGIFSAWVRTTWNNRKIDFWNLAGGTGRVLHQRVISTSADGQNVGFEVDLIHRTETDPVVDILRERWKVTVLPTSGVWHAFDLQSTQVNQTDLPLQLHEYHYGGHAVRGPVEWLTQSDSDVRKIHDKDVSPEFLGSTFLNDSGSDRIKGNHEHTRWVSMTGKLSRQPVTIAVLSHSHNYRAPQAARLHPTKPYFAFSPCVDGEFSIEKAHPYESRYRYLIIDGPADAGWIDEQWNAWHQE